jgi:T6SS, Phospholipase effector Tle1-like, catalytic domain
MAKNIILLSDGTGNAASKVWRTNVWRFFQALDLTSTNQVASYDDGVGTSAFKPLALLGGAFGWGLKRNVLDLYKFLCRNYVDDCQIYGLGFSRGAFTIRVLMGLVINQGIVGFESESELHRKAKAAYRAYRGERYHSIFRIERAFRFLRNIVIGIKNRLRGHKPYSKDDNRHPEEIRFVGVWDTVAAYGLPIEEMTRGVSKWLWPLELPDRNLSKRVKRACHAVALDDERTTFQPVLWNETEEPSGDASSNGKRYTKDERISQVWFAGVHSNVGGGYPDDSLAHVTLYWMMREALCCGVRFKSVTGDPPDQPYVMRQVRLASDKDGRLYDSRQGLGGYYRYGPRKLDVLCNMRFSRNKADAVRIAVPKIQASAFGRNLNGAHAYAPIGLPERYAVVADDGEIHDGDKNPFENSDHAKRRADGQEHVWNLVWWRRVVYFLTVAASLHLALFPLIYRTVRSAEFETPLRLVSEALRLLSGFVPGFFNWWISSFATNPVKFVVAAALVAVLIWIGSRLGAVITDKMEQIWDAKPQDIPDLPRGGVYALRTNAAYQWVIWAMKRHVVPFVSVVIILYGGITLASHLLFNLEDAAGLYCKESSAPRDVPWLGEIKAETPFRAGDFCWASGIRLVEGRRYHVTITQTSPVWKDASPLSPTGYQTDLAGVEISEVPGFTTRVALFIGVPLRRVLLRPWFRIIGRVGVKGTDEYFLDPDKPTGVDQEQLKKIDPAFRVRRDGELFLYVNDAAVGWPGIADVFYRGNEGEATVTVKHLTR